MRSLLILCLLISGCATIPQLPEPPDNGAVYRTDYETWIVENTTSKEFCNQMTDNKEIIESAYKSRDNKTHLQKGE